MSGVSIIALGLAAFSCTARLSGPRILHETEPSGHARFSVGPLSQAEREDLGEGELAQVGGVTAIDPELARAFFSLRLALDDDAIADDELPPVASSYEVDEAGRLVLRPTFPLTPGARYIATFASPRQTSASSRLEIDLPERVVAPSARVTAVFPSSATLPENLLKFYIEFSAPMARGEIWDRIRLRRADGEIVAIPFLELDEELWDPSGTRVTAFIDPGRLKRGVKPLEDLGPALVDGETLTLEIDREWRDAKGAPLLEGYTKRFRVGSLDRAAPDPYRWTLVTPRAGTRDALTVRFGESLDHGLLHGGLAVELSSSESRVVGSAVITENERVWTFVPEDPWATGEHALLMASTLEDLAGNSVGRLFEVDVFESVKSRVDFSIERLPFQPGQP